MAKVRTVTRRARKRNSTVHLWTAIIVLALVSIPVPLAAAPLVNGGVISDAISVPGEQDTHTFEANAGESVQIRVADTSNGPLSPRFELRRPDGSTVTSTSGSSVAHIECPTLACEITQTGTYSIVVSDATQGNEQTGSYNVYFVRLPGADEGGSLINGGVIGDQIDLGDLDSYTFEANAGESVQIRVADTSSGGTLSPWLFLYGPDGSLLTSSSGSGVAEIRCPTLACGIAATGTYSVVVADATQGGAGTGSYDIYFTRLPGANEGGALINGGVISDQIDLGDLDSYTFEANAGESVQIRVADTSDGPLSPWVFLYGPDGSLLTSSSGSTVAEIRCPTLACGIAATGTYSVVVADATQGRAQTGSYNIHFVRLPGANEGGALFDGSVVSDQIDLGDLDSYTFSANAGASVEISVTDTSADGALSPWLFLYGPDGALLTSASGSTVASTHCPSVACEIATSGTYSVVVADATSGRDQTGSYEIRLTLTGGQPETARPEKETDLAQCDVEKNQGNPVNIALGFKVQRETDYASGDLSFTRTYRSDATWFAHRLGQQWRHSYGRSLIFQTSPAGETVDITTGRGTIEVFREDPSGAWLPVDPDITSRFSEDPGGGYVYIRGGTSGVREIFNADGRLTRIAPRGGRALDLAYDILGRLETVTDEQGQSLTLEYDAQDRITTLGTADGIYIYGYDGQGNLMGVTKPDGTSRVYHYEDAGFPHALTGITDENGVRFATYGYDDQGRAISTEHAGGVDNYTVAYNPDETTTLTNPLGKQTTYTFQTIHGVRKIVRVEGHQSANCAAANKAYTYDAQGFRRTETDWEGNVTTYVRDSRGLVTSMTEASGSAAERTTTFTFDSVYRLPDIVTETGLTTDYDYDAQGRMTSRTLIDTATGETRTTAYDYHPDSIDALGNLVLGRLARIDGPRTDVNDVTDFEYDEQYRLVRTVNALGHIVETLSFDAANRPTLMRDENGIETRMVYDVQGRLTKVFQANGTVLEASTRTIYDAKGRIRKIIAPNGTVLRYVYDDADRLIKIFNSDSRIVYTLDNAGNRTKEVYRDDAGVVRYKYVQVFDELSRRIRGVDGNGDKTKSAYDLNSNLTRVIDGNQNKTRYVYDELDRQTKTIDALDGRTVNTFNELNQLTKVKDPRENATRYVYNAFGDVLKEISPDRGAITYSYDEAGNLVRRKDARGIITKYTYDALNRLVKTAFPSDPSLNLVLTYDMVNGCGVSVGQLCRVKDAAGITRYVYDELGRLIRVKEKRDTLTFVTEYDYDLSGNITDITYPSGRVVSYEYNANNDVISVDDGSTNLADAITYLPFGSIESLLYGNGLDLYNTFNTAYQLTDRQIGGVLNDSYEYDGAGNMTLKGVTDYGYDDLYRLLNENGAAGLYDYSYDAIGNRLTETKNGAAASYSYPLENSKLSAIDFTPITHDAAGNITQDASRSYTIDAAGHIKDVSIAGAAAGTYVYDASNQRTRKTASGIKTHYVYGRGGLLYGEYDASGAMIREYVYLDGEPLAQVDAGEELIYLHTDHLGTPRVATNASGIEVWRWTSDAFGNGTPTGSATVNLRFPGQYYDDESRLHYNWNRYYDPETGRYISSDPIGLTGGLNTFAYVGANPVMFVDPEGFQIAAVACIGGEATLFGGLNVSMCAITRFTSDGKPKSIQPVYILSPRFGIALNGGGTTGIFKGETPAGIDLTGNSSADICFIVACLSFSNSETGSGILAGLPLSKSGLGVSGGPADIVFTGQERSLLPEADEAAGTGQCNPDQSSAFLPGIFSDPFLDPTTPFEPGKEQIIVCDSNGVCFVVDL